MTSRRNFLGASLASTLALLIPSRASAKGTSTQKTKVCKISDIPVSGGKVYSTSKGPVLITQPTKGTFRAFSAICTHQGCTIGLGSTVNAVKGGAVACPCHGATFNASTGAVVRGPARSALPKFTVTTDSTFIYI